MAARIVNFSKGEKVEQQILLSEILTSQNPRQELRGVLEKFHAEGAAHNSPESRAAYVAYIDANFDYVRNRAESIKSKGQLEAVTLRRFESKGEDKYGIVMGECRILAWGIIEAETGVPQKVRAVVAPKMTLDEAFDLAITENIEREDMNPLDIGKSLYEMLTERINPLTVKAKLSDDTDNPLYVAPKGRPYTMKELSEKFRKDYNWVRGRAALPFLNEKDQLQLVADFKAGKRSVTKFVTKALKLAIAAKKSGSVDFVENLAENQVDNNENPDNIVVVKPEQRRRVKPLKDVCQMFDATPSSNQERLATLAEVMGITLEVATQESTDRKVKQELAVARQALKEEEQTQQEEQAQEVQESQSHESQSQVA